MSRVIIYLDRMLPYGSSNLPVTRRATVSSRLGLASDGVYRACPVTRPAVSSYLAISPLPAEAGGIFLLHFPGSRLRRTLSGTLPCEARTVLSRSLSVLPAATAYPARRTCFGYYRTEPVCLQVSLHGFRSCFSMLYTSKQLPPINSRRIEFFGTSSDGYPRK